MVQELARNWTQLRKLMLDNCQPLNVKTWDTMKQNCLFLQQLGFTLAQPTLTFQQECSLFEKIPTLNAIKCENGGYKERLFTRTEYHEQDIYLERYHETYPAGQVKRVS